ncbi:GH36-type glycosyl hydrolase domain-containing protein [Paenibacillus sp. N3.4]|uniref:GH36-type glycosyl hydrolase domain-containing protein n=1 Tax=Paenibacillus sp. N3.4 TaxID=2603222 RepID=UPI0011CCA15F|nr:amylo-alpha-1,6-glucosidase [Paenibacillus sp. N3.4]TXK81014.1 cellobiose phosphorylase [Paenibacillus sp. N3.4]
MTAIKNETFQLEAGNLKFTFLSSGDLYEAKHHETMINQRLSNPIDGSLNNLYLRFHKASGIQTVPLLGIRSASRVRYAKHQVIWEGEAEGIGYQVVFRLTANGVWFWDVHVEGRNKTIDIVYGQDLGIADQGAVRSNEAYLSQYIDHATFEDEQQGFVVCSRQNMPQSGKFPYLQQGAMTKAIGYSTDGFQFFGLSYKETDIPEIWTKNNLANEVYQYEFAYTALQSEQIILDGDARYVFYGLFKEDHPAAVTALEYSKDIEEAWNQVKDEPIECEQHIEKAGLAPHMGAPLQTLSMTMEEIGYLFPNRHQEERDGESLLSFFTDRHEHVVLKEKELLVERPHGHILMTGRNDRMNEQVLTTTSFMYGIFNSQLVVGNTSFNKMMTNARDALNVSKTSGQRIYVEIEGEYRLLTMPSMFEMGFNYARWFYKTAADTLVITNYTTLDTPEVRLHVRSSSGKAYRYLITNHISMNANEYELPFGMRQDEENTVSFYADAAALSAGAYPNLSYRMQITGAQMKVTDERSLVSGIQPGSASLVVLELSASSEWTAAVQGLLDGEELPFAAIDTEAEIERYRAFYKGVMNGFHLTLDGNIPDEVNKVNTLAWWYTHNMLVHFSVPHGLEQYGGAAWGTRDVCQGPTEYFMATQKYEAVREIVTTVFAHQYEDEGNWPQWFMFDRYFHIQQEESHGDIIVWPLKVLGDYLKATQDYAILSEQVPYTDRESFTFTEETATVLEHAKKEIAYIKRHFLHDTHLSSYGDGDWDDTLQPANAQLKKYMISSWTVALTYQVVQQLSEVLREIDRETSDELQDMAEGIKADYSRYMLQSEVIPGFVYMEEPGKAELMLHPSDTKTGIEYRLLPMTRSMIAELLTPEQAEQHFAIIKEKLYCPDGVRLMNRPAKYDGGVSSHFKRAEQAANFGREVGLQYVHAHIRYVEAMAKLGKVDEVWKGLAMINPVGLRHVVPNAELRQSNAYFSSSDGKFNNRYEAQSGFQRLRDGSVPVKGGWRIYSSGPGIYMNQLISGALGIRQLQGDLMIDPVLPQQLDGLRFDYECMGVPVTFIYRLGGDKVQRVMMNGKEVAAEASFNRYRQGGVRIPRQEFIRNQSNDTNTIEIFM